MEKIEFRMVSSLEKVMLNSEKFYKIKEGSCLKNERYSFQIAYKAVKNKTEFNISVFGDTEGVTVRKVENVPSELPSYENERDEDYITHTPGLFPDPLFPLKSDLIYAMPYRWHSLWITVDASKYKNTGKKKIVFAFDNDEEEIHNKMEFSLEIINADLPKQELIYTDWIHLDCIAKVHNVKIFSKKHWDLIEEYVKTASHIGINMLLVPLFTPPIDTAIGQDRPTVQLVGVEKINNEYKFDFTLLLKYLNILRKYNIEYFEFSHLFTQWGAKSTPKIIVKENGRNKKMFGWHISAELVEYKKFLNEILPAIKKFIKKEKIEDKVYFHISDEPNFEHIDNYKYAKNLVSKYLKDCKIIDALSNVEFYKEKLVDIPVPATDHFDEFSSLKLEEKWTYYCCAQSKNVSNRFFAMPSYRNRIIGCQLYKSGIHGFLHWGYNFYFSQFSKRVINPYRVTDADCAFPSGDSFVVYPYKNEAVESLRSEVFYEGIQDMRALKLMESIIGRDKTVEFMEECFETEITFKNYPKSIEALLDFREKLNKFIKERTEEFTL